uniref:Multidrug efflux pump subunit AcrB n=1 Tax=Candidatus Kentrum sp. FW TaxID=2126338 RepID=A0A450TR87_9GAMM|nr:MAG: Multidrug efflux pump subunit AcrB [Candidatus Kentron sp. FW]
MIEWFTRNGVAANLLMVLILGLGIHALSQRIPLEVFPDIELNAVTISMVFRGATPVEVEEGVVVRIEEAISNLVGIERIISNANEGSARLRVELEDGYDPREVLDDIKTRVDAINTFPAEAERPIYGKLQHRREVISVVLSADLPERQLRQLGEQVRDDLLALPDITRVDLAGVRDYEITIEVSQHTLERFGLGFDDIVDAVRDASRDYPAGSLETRRGEILLRTRGQAYTGEDFARTPIMAHSDGTYLTLADIADIKDGFEEAFRHTEFNGRPAVLLEVYRAGDQDAITLAREVRAYIENAQRTLPPGVAIDYWEDTSRTIELGLEILAKSAIQGGILIFLVLTLFLRLSVAVWVCVGIPVSFMGALALMPELGVTMNIVSVFGFILVLGIVVDDAIVTGENIYTHLERGEDPIASAIRGTREVIVPVTFGILTTVVAFVPLAFVKEGRGAIFASIAMVVIPVLLFSLVGSKLILPAHLGLIRVGAGSGGRHPDWLARMQRRVADGLERGIDRYYRPLLGRVLEYRFLTLALFIGLSFVLLCFVLSGRHGFTFLPRIQSEIIRATLVMPRETAIGITDRHMARILAAAHHLRDKYRDPNTGVSIVGNILLQMGWSSSKRVMGGKSYENRIMLALVPPDERAVTVTASTLVDEWRRAIGSIPGARGLDFHAEIGRLNDVIDIRLMGGSLDGLAAAAEKVKKRLSEYPEVFNIRDSLDTGREEIKLTPRPDAEFLGITVSDLGIQVRQAFWGVEAQRIQRGRNDVRVMVRYPLAERRAIVNLTRMRIRTPGGIQVPLGTVADVTIGRGFSTIHRVDRRRVVNVTADIDKEKTDINRITRDLESFLADLRPHHPDVRYTLEGELREQRESFASFYFGVALVLFVIYALLAIPFRSYAQPLIVMGVIPFSVVGALLGHIIMGMNLSIMSVWGLLALMGVVVNDSLMLVDYTNRRHREGVPLQDAISMAGVARFRPILLTSLTTFAGLIPLIFEKTTQAQFMIPMAVSLGFGILYATLLTLFLVPVGYRLIEDARLVLTRENLPREVKI